MPKKGDSTGRQHGPWRILVIDDTHVMADITGRLLETQGHRVAVAYDGPQALQRAREFLPKIVLCDINLSGGMTGYDVASALRQEPQLRDAILVAVTGYEDEEDRRRSEQAGFNAHMVKPVSIDALEDLLAKLMQ